MKKDRGLEDPRTTTFKNFRNKHRNSVDSIILTCDFSIGKKGYGQIKNTVSKPDDKLPSAPFVESNTMGIDTIKALQENHIEIPECVGIIGFKNLDLSHYITPSLSKIRPATNQLGATSVMLFQAIIDGTIFSPVKRFLRKGLVLRDGFM